MSDETSRKGESLKKREDIDALNSAKAANHPGQRVDVGPSGFPDKGTGQTSITAQFRFGPLPPPEEMERYKKIDPRINAALIEAFREQWKHRHAIENKDTDAFHKNVRYELSIQKLGLWLGWFLAAAILVA